MADYDLQYQDTYIDALLATANELKTAGYIFKGVATPSTNPGTPTERVAYLASEPGTYTNFGGIVITSGLYSLTYASGIWTGTQMSAGSDIEVVQTTGQSTSAVMSQKAVTDEVEIKEIEVIDLSTIQQINFSLWGNAWHSTTGYVFIKKVDVSEGETYRIVADADYKTQVFFMAVYNPVNNATVAYTQTIIKQGTTEEIIIPEGMNFMVFQDDHARSGGGTYKLPSNVELITKTAIKDCVEDLYHKFDYVHEKITLTNSLVINKRYVGGNDLQWKQQAGDTYIYPIEGYEGNTLTITRGLQRPRIYFAKDNDTTIGHSSVCDAPNNQELFPNDVKAVSVVIPEGAKYIAVFAGWQAGSTEYIPASIVINEDKYSPVVREKDGRQVTKSWNISIDDNSGLLSGTDNSIITDNNTADYRTSNYIKVEPKGKIAFADCYAIAYGYSGVHLYDKDKNKLMQFGGSGVVNLSDFPALAYIRFSGRQVVSSEYFLDCSVEWTYTSMLTQEDIDEINISSVYVELTQSMAEENILHEGYNYFVGSVIDLDGGTLNIPNCTLKFGNDGKIINGSIVFDNSKIDAMTSCFIDDSISGTLAKQDINAIWFYKNDIGAAVTQSSKLLNGNGRVFITQGTYDLFTPMLVKGWEILDLNGSGVLVHAHDCPCIDSFSYEGNNVEYSYIKICNMGLFSQTSSARTFYHIDVANSSKITYENIKISTSTNDGTKVGIRLGRKLTGFSGATFVQRVIRCNCPSIYVESGCTDGYINGCELWCDANSTVAEACVILNANSWSISDNQLVGGSRGAIVINGSGLSMIRITNNYFDGSYNRLNTHDGITGSAISSVIANNLFWHQNGCGIKATLTGTAINSNAFDGNDKDNTGDSDIVILGGEANTIVGNTFRRIANTLVPAMRLTDNGLKTTIVGNSIITPDLYSANVYNNVNNFVIANNNNPTLFGE